jgi:hypothetical protein
MGHILFNDLFLVEVLQETPYLAAIGGTGDIAKRLVKLLQKTIDVMDLEVCQALMATQSIPPVATSKCPTHRE